MQKASGKAFISARLWRQRSSSIVEINLEGNDKVLAAHPACNDKEKERLVVAALAGGIRVPERKGPPLIRAKVVAAPPPFVAVLAKVVVAANRDVAATAAAPAAAFARTAESAADVGETRRSAATWLPRDRRPARVPPKATATVNKLGAAASSSTSVGELLLSPTKTRAPGVARGSLEESYLLWLRASARGAKLAPNSTLPETLRDGSALCALLRHLNLPAMNNDASVVDNDPKSTEQAIANFALALGAGQDKRAKFATSKAPISAVFHSFWLILGRAIISRNGLEAWMLFLERARAEHSR